jgi:hypothetical protein
MMLSRNKRSGLIVAASSVGRHKVCHTAGGELWQKKQIFTFKYNLAHDGKLLQWGCGSHFGIKQYDLIHSGAEPMAGTS